MRLNLRNDGCEVGDARYVTAGCGREGGEDGVQFVAVEILVRQPGDIAFAVRDSVHLHLPDGTETLDADDLVRRVRQRLDGIAVRDEFGEDDFPYICRTDALRAAIEERMHRGYLPAGAGVADVRRLIDVGGSLTDEDIVAALAAVREEVEAAGIVADLDTLADVIAEGVGLGIINRDGSASDLRDAYGISPAITDAQIDAARDVALAIEADAA